MRAELHTPLCELLDIEFPVLQAGMARTGASVTPPELVAAVSNAGGMGCVGATSLAPDEIRDYIREIRTLTDRTFGVDLLVPASLDGPDLAREDAREFIRTNHPEHVYFVEGLYEQMGIEHAGGNRSEFAISNELIRRQVAALMDERVPVFVSALGDPAWAVPEAHRRGIKVIGVAGAPRHALRQVAAGVDAIIAQGSEAGGHVGGMASMPLIPQAVDAAGSTPVVAAGGIGDGRGLAAALALGAQGVWCGTAFLFSREANVPQAHRDALAAAGWSDVETSRVYTGKPSRTVLNVVKEAWHAGGLEPLPMQLQMVLMEDFCADAEAAGREDLTENAAGQVVEMYSSTRSASEIVEEMVAVAVETIQRLQSTLVGRPKGGG
ncbi:MAG: nitronate monooxygenase [Actinomycetota bacterium]|nr:nitronate monooxygenase [Actinomycetota bacterium]